MPRIRTIKPEFWADEKLAPLPVIDRLVFLGLVSMADDAGRLIDSVRQIDGMLFPFTEDTCGPSLETLARLSRIRRYTSESGQRLIQIEGWERHQKIDNPSRYTLPAPPQKAVAAEPIPQPRETLATTSRDPSVPILDLGPTTYDLRPGSVDLPRTTTHARDAANVNGNGGAHHDELADWLGPYAPAIEGNPLAVRPRDRRSLFQEYGPPSLRANAWRLSDGGQVPPADRSRIFAVALNAYEREGHRTIVGNEFSGCIRTAAGQEALPRGSPTPTTPLTAAQYRRYSEIRRELEDGGMDPDEAAAEADQRARRE